MTEPENPLTPADMESIERRLREFYFKDWDSSDVARLAAEVRRCWAALGEAAEEIGAQEVRIHRLEERVKELEKEARHRVLDELAAEAQERGEYDRATLLCSEGAHVKVGPCQSPPEPPKEVLR